MRSTTAASLLVASALSSQALAANVVPIRITKAQNSQTQSTRRSIVSRQTISEPLANNVTGGSYMASISVGSPAQKLSLVLDTGSSDVWMLDVDADLCTDPALQNYYGTGCTGGLYDPSKSSSYKLVDANGFSIQYVDGTGSEGDYITDNLSIGGSTIKTLQMGLAYNTTVGVGIIGVGYDTNEAASTPYPSIIDQLVSQNLINTKAYSLYLDDLYDSTGTILFGGIDTDKYIGELSTLDVQPDAQSGSITSFTLAWTSLTLTANGSDTSLTRSTFDEAAILDSGTTLTYVPDALATDIYDAVGAVDDSSNSGVIYINCDMISSETTLNYQFGGSDGPVIKVPFTELIFTLESLFGDTDYFNSVDLPFDNTCAFGIYANGDSQGQSVVLLGDTFLRSAYVVYDLTNNEISLGQTNFNSTQANIIEISSGSAIPSASGVSSQATASQTATGNPGEGPTSSVTGTTSATATGTTTTTTSSTASPTSTSTSSSARNVVPAFGALNSGVVAFVTLFALMGASMILA